jgi:hypothetical protein
VSHAAETTIQCLSCDRTDAQAPLVGLRFAGRARWICSACLPKLIHRPEELADKLAGADVPSGPSPRVTAESS